MNLIIAEEWQLHGAMCAQQHQHSGAHGTCLHPSSCASFGKQQEVGLQLTVASQALTIPQTQQYPETQYFTVYLEGGYGRDYEHDHYQQNILGLW